MSDDKDDDKPSGSEKSRWTEAVKELTATGLAAYFMTEDSVRGLLKEKKLPKEIVSILLDNVGRKKDDLLAVIGKELGKVLGQMDIAKEMQKILETHDVHFQAKVSFRPKKDAEEAGENDARDGSDG